MKNQHSNYRLWLAKYARAWGALILCSWALTGQAAAQAIQPQSSQSNAAQEHIGQRVQLTQRQAMVDHLRRQVDQLEASNGQANTRLQQQDRVIAELRRQLQSAQTPAAVISAGH